MYGLCLMKIPFNSGGNFSLNFNELSKDLTVFSCDKYNDSPCLLLAKLNIPFSLWENCKCFFYNYDAELALLSHCSINHLYTASQFCVLFSSLQNSLSTAFIIVIADYS